MNSKCPKHNIEYVESDGALRCASQGCTHFVELTAPAVTHMVPEYTERRDEGRAERDEAFQVEKEQTKPKKKKGK